MKLLQLTRSIVTIKRLHKGKQKVCVLASKQREVYVNERKKSHNKINQSKVDLCLEELIVSKTLGCVLTMY